MQIPPEKLTQLVSFMKHEDGTLDPEKLIKVFEKVKMQQPKNVVSALLSMQGTPITAKQFVSWCK